MSASMPGILDVANAHRKRFGPTGLMCSGCDFAATERKLSDQDAQFSRHVVMLFVAVVEAERADALTAGLAWFSEAALEASRKVTPESTPSLAGQYWRGYQAATQEIVDLLAEPALVAKALEQAPAEAPTRVKQWLSRGNRAASSSMAR